MSDPNETAAIARSVRRAASRADVMLALFRLGEATPAVLAEVVGVDQDRLSMVLHGKLPHYRPDLSPVALGHVRVRHTRHGTLLELTGSGRAAMPAILEAIQLKAERAKRLRRRARDAILRHRDRM